VVVGAAVWRSGRARDLVKGLLAAFRVHGCFDQEHGQYERQSFLTLRQALQREGWHLSDESVLTVQGDIDLATGGREARSVPLEALDASHKLSDHRPTAWVRQQNTYVAGVQNRRSALVAYSHSMVPGGLLVTSSTTRLISRTSLVMRVEIRASTS
jgi:hypothetical protein